VYCAAESGSVSMLRYLKQHGAVSDAATMRCAAQEGHQHVLLYLHAEGCQFDELVPIWAVQGGAHYGTVRWLHGAGCGWNTYSMAVAAAHANSVAVLQYVFEHTVQQWSAADLTAMLNVAGAHNKLDTAMWLRHQAHAVWPTVLQYSEVQYAKQWYGATLAWEARSEGCISPIISTTTT
jgi:hypothetical protein